MVLTSNENVQLTLKNITQSVRSTDCSSVHCELHQIDGNATTTSLGGNSPLQGGGGDGGDRMQSGGMGV